MPNIDFNGRWSAGILKTVLLLTLWSAFASTAQTMAFKGWEAGLQMVGNSIDNKQPLPTQANQGQYVAVLHAGSGVDFNDYFGMLLGLDVATDKLYLYQAAGFKWQTSKPYSVYFAPAMRLKEHGLLFTSLSYEAANLDCGTCGKSQLIHGTAWGLGYRYWIQPRARLPMDREYQVPSLMDKLYLQAQLKAAQYNVPSGAGSGKQTQLSLGIGFSF